MDRVPFGKLSFVGYVTSGTVCIKFVVSIACHRYNVCHGFGILYACLHKV